MKQWSLDARSKGQPWPLPYCEVERVGWPSLGWTGEKGRAVEGSSYLPVWECERGIN